MLTTAAQLLRATLRNRAGVSSIEYGVLAVGLIVAVGAAMSAFSVDLTAAFDALGAAVKAAF